MLLYNFCNKKINCHKLILCKKFCFFWVFFRIVLRIFLLLKPQSISSITKYILIPKKKKIEH